jgi:hypothetical protein
MRVQGVDRRVGLAREREFEIPDMTCLALRQTGGQILGRRQGRPRCSAFSIARAAGAGQSTSGQSKQRRPPPRLPTRQGGLRSRGGHSTPRCQPMGSAQRISLFDAAYPDGQPLPEAMVRSSAGIISKSAISGGFGATGVRPPCATILRRCAGGGSSR